MSYSYNTETKEEVVFGSKCINDFLTAANNTQTKLERTLKDVNKILKEIYGIIDSDCHNESTILSEIEFVKQYGDISKVNYLDEMMALIKVKLTVPWHLTLSLSTQNKIAHKNVDKQTFLNNNEELVIALTTYELIKDSIDPVQFNWELSTMKSIQENLNQYGSLTEKQISLFIKLVNKEYVVRDFTEVREKLNTLRNIKPSYYDADAITSLYFSLKHNNTLSDVQVGYVDKLYKRHRRQIKDLEEDEEEA